MHPLSYRRHRFPPVVIQHAVWLYLRFSLSYRDVEELLAERGLDISYESVRSWVLKFGPAIARALRRWPCHLWMPPALQAVITRLSEPWACSHLSGLVARSVTAGLGGIRGSTPPSRCRACCSDNASGLADPGCPVSPSPHRHPRNPVGSGCRLNRQQRSGAGRFRCGAAWPRQCARSCWRERAARRWSGGVRAKR